MSNFNIISNARLGSIIAWSNGATRPPERHVRKLADWKSDNGQGRLVSKSLDQNGGGHFTIHIEDITSKNVLVARFLKTLSVGTSLSLHVVETPASGDIHVFDVRSGELLSVHESRDNATGWASRNGYHDAVIAAVP